jgi:heterodisulfide reductase subunit C
MVSEMDIPPSKVMRYLQYQSFEYDQKLYKCKTIWLCVSCETCYERCPQMIDIPAVMDSLRHESRGRRMANKDSADILAFFKSFLNSVKTNGRLSEFLMIIEYKIRTANFFQDILLAPRLLMRGKLEILPHRIKGRNTIKRMFKRASREENA